MLGEVLGRKMRVNRLRTRQKGGCGGVKRPRIWELACSCIDKLRQQLRSREEKRRKVQKEVKPVLTRRNNPDQLDSILQLVGKRGNTANAGRKQIACCLLMELRWSEVKKKLSLSYSAQAESRGRAR
jgi:hypothetical protein